MGLSGKDDNLIIAKKLGKKVVDEETGEVKVKVNAFRRRIVVVLSTFYPRAMFGCWCVAQYDSRFHADQSLFCLLRRHFWRALPLSTFNRQKSSML